LPKNIIDRFFSFNSRFCGLVAMGRAFGLSVESLWFEPWLD